MLLLLVRLWNIIADMMVLDMVTLLAVLAQALLPRNRPQIITKFSVVVFDRSTQKRSLCHDDDNK